jgi:5-methyltetrahydrofolate--homocysteine methyltransferase
MKRTLRSLLGRQILFFDGATGTVLQNSGLKPGELPETWNILHPEKIIELHYNYLKAGANIVKTNTFGAYTTKYHFGTNDSLPESGSAGDLASVVKAAVVNAREACRRIEENPLSPSELTEGRKAALIPQGQNPGNRPHFVALDIGPSGKLLKPMGDLDFEKAVELFKTTIRLGVAEGVDAVLIETMNDCYEAKAAVLAAKEIKDEFIEAARQKGDPNLELLYSDIPIFCTTVYDENGQLLTGADPETMTAILESLGVDAFGMNCGLGPIQMEPLVSRLTSAASIPVIVNPNAGLPRRENGRTIYDVDAFEFARVMEKIVTDGACLVGGCCGTDPEFICRVVNACQKYKVDPVQQKNDTIVSSYTHSVKIGGDAVPVLIGERINPTGKKKFKQALRDGNIPYIIQQGIDQESCGAVILDVNVGLPEIDEKEMMISVVTELQGITDLPLQIDTSSSDVMEAALRRYNGKALINSVNGKQESMKAVFPLVKKYGGVVVALTLDEHGIPDSVDGRISIVKKIYQTAADYGINRKNILIDPLAMAVSADSGAPSVTLETVRAVHELGGSTILGVSNVSFGLPSRDLANGVFFTMAMQCGLSAAIINPKSEEMKKAFYGFCLLRGKDPQCLNYIDFTRNFSMQQDIQNIKPSVSSATQREDTPVENDPLTLQYAVIHGLKENAALYAKELLNSLDSLEIINTQLVPALDSVGKQFETKKIFLPQLLMSAEAAKSAFSVIKDSLAATGRSGKSRGKIVLATVKGDIHDIGKNIVKILLENYDFTVLDLGKDVSPELIVDTCIREHVPLVGLSALMTTTVPSMEKTIKLLRKKAPWAKVCVGGAVMTKEYADMIGADFYGKDAMEAVKFARSIM